LGGRHSNLLKVQMVLHSPVLETPSLFQTTGLLLAPKKMGSQGLHTYFVLMNELGFLIGYLLPYFMLLGLKKRMRTKKKGIFS